MKLRVELDLTPQELTELTQNHQVLWQNLQMQFWSQVSQQMMKMSPLGGFYPTPDQSNDERGGHRS